MAWIRNLEIHLSHACNLTCESCVHFSNQGHKGMLSLEDAETWYGWWSHRLEVKQFCLMGGEPTLNRDLCDHIRLAARFWRSRSQNGLLIVSNGFYLDRHPDLFETLKRTGCRLDISIHHQDAEYRRRLQPGLSTAMAWKAKGLRVNIRKSFRTWYRNYLGFGANMKPFRDGKPRRSWEICHSRDCRQLHDGKLWKCPPVAYLPMQKERYPGLSADWDSYLAYEPLDHTANNEQLLEFLNRKAESCCSMCPAHRRNFAPESPLVPVGQLLRRSG